MSVGCLWVGNGPDGLLTFFPRNVPVWVVHLLLALTGGAHTSAASSADRRVVDVAVVGDVASEAAHGFDGEGVVNGVLRGRTFRQTTGWLHFALTVFDDTEVTVALSMVNPDTTARRFELVVEDSVVATPVVPAGQREPLLTQIVVPFARTKGKSHIVVLVRARGGITPGIHEIRTIQDHFELDASLSPSGVAR